MKCDAITFRTIRKMFMVETRNNVVPLLYKNGGFMPFSAENNYGGSSHMVWVRFRRNVKGFAIGLTKH